MADNNFTDVVTVRTGAGDSSSGRSLEHTVDGLGKGGFLYASRLV